MSGELKLQVPINLKKLHMDLALLILNQVLSNKLHMAQEPTKRIRHIDQHSLVKTEVALIQEEALQP